MTAQAIVAHPLALLFIVINTVAFFVMGWDKLAAKGNRRRVPEKTLFLLAVCFGAIGATLGMFLFHHKTRKFHFRLGFPALAIVQVVALYFLFTTNWKQIFLFNQGGTMAIEEVRSYLAQFGADGAIQEFDVSSATVELASQALGIEGARIAKSIALYTNPDKNAVQLVVVAGDARIDNRKFRERFGCKPSFCAPEDTLAATGHAVGGVCPFALKTPIPVFLDESLRRFTSVYPACGSSNSAIEVTMPDLERLSGSVGWVDVCKDWAAV